MHQASVDDSVHRVEGPLGVDPPHWDTNHVEELGFFTALGESTHDSGITGVGAGLVMGEGERTRVVDNHVADDAMDIVTRPLEVSDGDDDDDVCEALQRQVLKALLGMGDEGAEKGSFRILGEGREGHVGGAVQFNFKDNIHSFL